MRASPMASNAAALRPPRRWLWLPASLVAAGLVWLAQLLPPPSGDRVRLRLAEILVPAVLAAVALAIAMVVVIAVRARLQDHLPVVQGEEPLLSPPRLPAARRRQPVVALAGLESGAADSIAFNLAVLAAVAGEIEVEGVRRRPRPACVLPAGPFSERLGTRANALAEFLAAHPYRLSPEVVSLATWHPSGCELFALEPGNRGVEYLKLLVPALRRLYDLVLLACDVEDRYLADSAAELSDSFIVVGAAGSSDSAAAADWLDRIWSLGLEQKSGLIVAGKTAGRDPMGDVAARSLYHAELPGEPAVEILDSRGLPWAIDPRLASSRQLELSARQLLPHLFSRSHADAA